MHWTQRIHACKETRWLQGLSPLKRALDNVPQSFSFIFLPCFFGELCSLTVIHHSPEKSDSPFTLNISQFAPYLQENKEKLWNKKPLISYLYIYSNKNPSLSFKYCRILSLPGKLDVCLSSYFFTILISLLDSSS